MEEGEYGARGVWWSAVCGVSGRWVGDAGTLVQDARFEVCVGSEGVVEVVWDTWGGDGREVEDGDSGSRIGERERGVATGGRWTSRTAVADRGGVGGEAPIRNTMKTMHTPCSCGGEGWRVEGDQSQTREIPLHTSSASAFVAATEVHGDAILNAIAQILFFNGLRKPITRGRRPTFSCTCTCPENGGISPGIRCMVVAVTEGLIWRFGLSQPNPRAVASAAA